MNQPKTAFKASDSFIKLIEQSFDGITLLDHDLNIIYRSPATERITGWTNGAAEGGFDTIHPDDRAAVRASLDLVTANNKEPVSLTFRSWHREGRYIWLECRFSDRFDDPELGAILCNFRDITEKKEFDERLQQTHQELLAYKYALDESAIVAITDQKGVIKHVNDNFCRIASFPKRN